MIPPRLEDGAPPLPPNYPSPSDHKHPSSPPSQTVVTITSSNNASCNERIPPDSTAEPKKTYPLSVLPIVPKNFATAPPPTMETPKCVHRNSIPFVRQTCFPNVFRTSIYNFIRILTVPLRRVLRWRINPMRNVRVGTTRIIVRCIMHLRRVLKSVRFLLVVMDSRRGVGIRVCLGCNLREVLP